MQRFARLFLLLLLSAAGLNCSWLAGPQILVPEATKTAVYVRPATRELPPLAQIIPEFNPRPTLSAPALGSATGSPAQIEPPAIAATRRVRTVRVTPPVSSSKSTGRSAIPVQPGIDVDLSQYKGRKCPVVVFAPWPEYSSYRKIVADFRNQPAKVKEHDIVLFEILEEGQSRVDGVPLSEASARAIRAKLNPGGGRFQVSLVGTDGAEKLRGGHDVTADLVFALVDIMGGA
jgi:hypothetical protein